jgi:hypothetical protein
VLILVALVWANLPRRRRVLRPCGPLWPAAVFVGSSFAFLLYAARAYVDVPFLRARAVGRRARRRARRARPAGHGDAGRRRAAAPEAWVLAGAYWLWCGWRRVDLLALAVAARRCVVPGRPVGHRAIRSSRCTPPATWPTSSTANRGCPRSGLVRLVRDRHARWPVALAAAAAGSAAVAAAHRPLRCTCRSRSSGAACVTFLATGLAGLSVLPRYLTIPWWRSACRAAYARRCAFTTLRPGTACATCGRRERPIAAAVDSALVFAGDQGARARARCAASCASSSGLATTTYVAILPRARRSSANLRCAARWT